MNALSSLAPLEQADDKLDRSATLSRFAQLQRTVIKLLFSFRGRNPDFDARLVRLTTILKNAPKSLEALTEIDDAMAELLVGGMTRADSDREAPMLRFLDTLKTSGELRDELRSLRTKAERAQRHEAWLVAAEEAAATLSRALTREPADAEIELARKSLLTLLDSIQASSPDETLTAARAKLSRTADSTGILAAARELGRELKAQRLKLEHDQKELSSFLNSIIVRFEEFRGYLSRSSEAHRDSSESAAEIQSTMQIYADQIKEHIIDESEISLLKSLVLRELTQLETVVSEKTRRQIEGHEVASKDASGTLDQLQELESEITNLRNEIKEQHSLRLIDPLTGVYNRAGYNDAAKRERARWKRQRTALTLAVLDLDYFKKVNDIFGHAAGDNVLIALASLLRSHVRGTDIVCRFGGEEFVLLMPDTALDGATTLCEKLRNLLEQSQFRFKDTPVPVTMSCGVAEFAGEDSLDDVFERADRALYRAKELGRNRCCRQGD
jgi:diguanylate cyclase